MLFVFMLGAAFAQGEVKLVKVGYCENGMFLEGASDAAIKKGYGYEYIRKIASITGWKYEYVYGTWEELYKKLLDGQIDILPGISYTAERLQKINFPEYPIGLETYYIYKKASDEKVNFKASSLNGKKIGCVNSYCLPVLKNWLKEKNIDAQIVIFEEIGDLDKALLSGKVDAIISESISVRAQAEIEPLEKVGQSRVYVGISKKRNDLLKEMNSALTRLEQDDPFYIEELAKKYFGYNSVSMALSKNEKEWIETHGKIRIGYLNKYLPLSGTDKKNEPTGVFKDVINKIVSNLRLENKIQLEYTGYDDASQLIAALKDNQLDLVFPVSANSWFLEQKEVFRSKEVITTTMELVYRKQYREDATRIIAINKNNLIQAEYVRMHFDGASIIYFDSINECLDAVNDGKASSTIINSLRTRDYLKYYNNLKFVTLPYVTSRCFGVSYTNVDLLSLIDRGINSLDRDFAMTSTYNYAKEQPATLKEFMHDHMLSFLMVLFVVFAVIITLIVITVEKSRKQVLLYNMSHIDSMTELYNRRSYEEELSKNTPYPKSSNFVYITMDLNGLKFVNDNLGHSAGDEYIKGAAECMRMAFKSNRVYRVGGDEFVSMLNANEEQVENIMKQLNSIASGWKGRFIDEVSISYGASYAEKMPDSTIQEIIKAADKAMYEYKDAYYAASGKERRKV
ncbi:MAG: transporter substrate-binding domain-containing protein [Treponemataceae bacterium]|nr:transporter substrate-binding domain-containing protein [Treponemataceae bacterium]